MHEVDGKREEIRYLRCAHCNYLFFASLRQKNKYLRMTTNERTAFHNLLSGFKSESINRTGGDLWKDASVSSSEDNKNG